MSETFTSFYYSKGVRLCSVCNEEYASCVHVHQRELHEKKEDEKWDELQKIHERKFINSTQFPLALCGWIKLRTGGSRTHATRINPGETKMFRSVGQSFWTNGWEFDKTEEEKHELQKVGAEGPLVNFEGKNCMDFGNTSPRTYSTCNTFWGKINIEDGVEVYTICYNKDGNDDVKNILTKYAGRSPK